MSGDANAKPLLTDSQRTYASACLEQQETPQRRIEICRLGLGGLGASNRQRIAMLNQLAWAYYDLKEIEKSEDAFKEILSLDPNAELGLRGQAWIHYYRDDYDAAVEFFRQAVSRKPTGSNMAGLAASAHRGGIIDEVEFEERMRTALALDPEYTWAMRELAWFLNEQGRYDDALEFFGSAIELDPYDSYAHYGMAYVLSEEDRWEEAFEHITRTLDMQPDFVAAVSRRSLILLMLDRPKQALKDAEAVIDAKPTRADGFVRKARALSDLGRRSEAHSVLEEAETHIEQTSYLSYWRARLLADDEDYDAALLHIRRSVALEDANHFDHRLHAEIALWLGKTTEARGAINSALDEVPDAPYVMYTDALILMEEGQFGPSEARFDAAIEAGLSDEKLSDYLSALVAEGRFMQAIKMRVRYSDREAGSQDGDEMESN